MINFKGLKILLCQMAVVPGRPDLNADYIIKEIKAAEKRGIDLIIFPEAAVTGYLIGDLREDEAFLCDSEYQNQRIVAATKGKKIAAIWGTLTHDPNKKGEDGRVQRYNAALVAQNGQRFETIKSLHPNYRIFDDDRFFYSKRKVAEAEHTNLQEWLYPLEVKIRRGKLKLGVILCEDMWHEDYAFNPTLSLVEHGAELIVNLSASPWTWQKNRRRHKVVKDLMAEIRQKTQKKVCFVYVNNTGIQNNGKNIIIFDGSSTVYNSHGEIIFEVAPYQKGAHDFKLNSKAKLLVATLQDDAAELFLGLACAGREFIQTIPASMRRVFIGLSGGIDSAVTAAFWTHILGPKNVVAVNMPSQYNSFQTKNLAGQIAKNLGIEYHIIPIQKMVDQVAQATGVEPDSLPYQNIQARMRMEILATLAQKRGGVFTANWNKVEAAFGYGTLYADIAGFLSIIGDLVKREVYQMGDYLNKNIYKREVISRGCFEVAPSAELVHNQKDPFDYGNLQRRGYHDEMVRAFTEFRRNPEWFAELYLEGRLEKELKLDPGTLKKLFPTATDFIRDLEKHWLAFFGSYFKRIQGPPLPIVSKRAFGHDLREAMLSPHFTKRYQEIKKTILIKVG